MNPWLQFIGFGPPYSGVPSVASHPHYPTILLTNTGLNHETRPTNY